jgi:hypothetical protein
MTTLYILATAPFSDPWGPSRSATHMQRYMICILDLELTLELDVSISTEGCGVDCGVQMTVVVIHLGSFT